MARWRAPLGLAAISVIAGACSNFGLVGDEQQPLVRVSNLVDGGYLEPGTPVVVQITAPPAEEDVLTIALQLLDASGSQLWESVMEAPPLNEPIQVGPFADLGLVEGSYTLRFVVTTSLSSTVEELAFFHVVDDYELQALTAFPPVSASGSTASLAAVIVVPEGRDPLLRWWQADQLITEGMFSDGYDFTSWPTPEEAGIYAISVELFPVPPSLATMVQPLPFATRDVSVYVVSAEAAESSEQHLLLFRFDATLADSGTASDEGFGSPARVLSGFAPLYGALGSDIGYLIDPDRQLELPRSLFPAPGSPFSVSMSLSAADHAAGVLLTSAGQGLQLELALDEDGFPVATIESGATAATLTAGHPLGGDIATLTFSASQTNDGISMAWYQDGVQTAGAIDQPLTRVGDDSAEDHSGRAVVGGPEFSGIIGELGVYVRGPGGGATTDPRAAYTTLAMEAGENGWATGFDGTEPSADFPDVRRAGGYAVVGIGQSLAIPLPKTDTGLARVVFGHGDRSAAGTAVVVGATTEAGATVPIDGATGLLLAWRTDGSEIAIEMTRMGVGEDGDDADAGGDAIHIRLDSLPTAIVLTAGTDRPLLVDQLALSAPPEPSP